MKVSTHASTEGHSLRLVGFFLLAVTVLILASLSIRIGTVIHESKYNATHRFTVAAINAPGKVTIYSFNKPAAEIGILHMNHLPLDVSAGKAVGLMLDGTLPTENILTHGGVFSDMLEFLFAHKTYNGLNGFDVIRLATMLRITPPANIKTNAVTFPLDMKAQTTITRLFTDESISQENKSIHITNAAAESGLGARLEHVLTGSGANVISIDSSEKTVTKTTLVYSGKISYTAEKIASYLHVLPIQVPSAGLSDILIVLGKDAISREDF